MSKQILKLEELVGKTITQVLKAREDIFLKFDDNTYTQLVVETVYHGSGFGQHESYKVGISDEETDKEDHALQILGYYTELEYQNLLNESALKQRKEALEYEAKQRIETEDREKAWLKTLQKKYAVE
jgi:hypothetical protein